MTKFNQIILKIRNRLPGGIIYNTVKNSIKLYKDEPDCTYYKRQILLNLRVYFCIGRYGLMQFKRVKTHLPEMIYHVTPKENLEKIQREGLHNLENNMIFLTDSFEYISELLKRKKEPIVLQIDVKKMRNEGFEFYINDIRRYIWITASVPPEYITVKKE